MPIMYAGVQDVQVLSNAQFTTSGGNTSAADQLNNEGTATLTINDRASGTAAATLAVTHSEDNSSFSAVPTDALFTLSTGEAATFTDLSTSASSQTLGLLLQKLKRYIRIEIAGTSITHDVAVVYVAGKKYSGGIG